MPHTSHRKKRSTQGKRQEIVDDDGWTRITSSTPPSTALSRPDAKDALVPQKHDEAGISVASIKPMLPVKGTTLENMQAQFHRIQARWLETDFHKKLEQLLTQTILTQSPTITSCVVLGTGSFSGDALHWIDRHESAYYQLAAFKSILTTIERMQGRSVPAYAQEPFYNDLDTALLASLDITKADHPRGFELLDDCTFVYSPAAEPTVEEQVLAQNPGIWLHRMLRDVPEAETFQDSHEHAQLPSMQDLKNFPFHGSVIWWK